VLDVGLARLPESCELGNHDIEHVVDLVDLDLEV
jgi:hypothetical protein